MQVTKLETSKELAKIMTGESYFVWGRYAIIEEHDPCSTKHIETKWSDWTLYTREYNELIFPQIETIPAYTLDEILEVLPRGIEINGSGYLLKLDLPMKRIYYERAGYMTSIKEILFNNMSDLTEAAAGLLIWCDKGGYLK